MHVRRRTWIAALVMLVALLSVATFVQAESIIVQPGDTLRSIAARVGTTVDALVQANNLVNPDFLQPGQTLVVPSRGFAVATALPAPAAANSSGSASAASGAGSAGSSSPASPASAVNTAVPAPSGGRYTVRAGDTLTKIAARFGTTAAALMRANAISNPDLVAVGMVLTIPGANAAPVRPTGQPVTPATAGANPSTGGASTSAAAATPGGSAGATAASATPGAAARPGPQPGTRFVVSISKQHCWLYQNDVETGSWPCSTGRRGWGTATGTFQVRSKVPVAYGSTWNFYMPYWLGIYTVGTLENGIHGLPFRGNFHDWGNKIGTPISFGCIVLQDAAAKKVYEAATLGMPVIIKR